MANNLKDFSESLQLTLDKMINAFEYMWQSGITLVNSDKIPANFFGYKLPVPLL
jgi:hypothetical protein